MDVANVSQGNGATSCCARRLRTLKIKCPECKKKYEVRIASAAERVKCPLCGKEEELVNISKSIKKPIALHIACIIFYIAGASVLFLVDGVSGTDLKLIIGIGFAILCGFLFIVMGHLLSQGYGWPRFVLLLSICNRFFNFLMRGDVGRDVGPLALYLALAIAIFSSASRDWLSVKKEIRRIKKTRKVNAK